MKREGHLFRLLTRVWGVPAVDRLQVWGSRYDGGITPLPFRKGGSQARARSLVGSTCPGRTMTLPDLTGVLGGHASGWGGGISACARDRRAYCSLLRNSGKWERSRPFARGAVGGLQMTSAPDEAHHGLAGRSRVEQPSDPGRACPGVGARVGQCSQSPG